MSVTSGAGLTLLASINACQSNEQLQGMISAVWRSAALVGDDEAGELDGIARQRMRSRPAPQPAAPVTVKRAVSYFTPRRPQRSPDRQASRERRRMLGGSSCMPETMRQRYTESERAVLCIIAGEVKERGVCDLPIDAIAAKAGVSRSTVHNALRAARDAGHVRVTARRQKGRKNLTNLIEITSNEWRVWIKRGPAALRAAIGYKPLRPSKSTVRFKNEWREERSKRDFQHHRGRN